MLDQQLEYYRARAGEYDRWWEPRGRYHWGPTVNARWAAECQRIRDWLASSPVDCRAAELATGTGIWTEQLAPRATTLTVEDGAPELVAINAARVPGPHVQRVRADLLTDELPGGPFDTIFFSFWLSHVPHGRFEPFWEQIRERLAPGGTVLRVDSRYTAASTAPSHTLKGVDATTFQGQLNDSRSYSVVTVFWEPHSLCEHLTNLPWTVDAGAMLEFFWHASATQ